MDESSLPLEYYLLTPVQQVRLLCGVVLSGTEQTFVIVVCPFEVVFLMKKHISLRIGYIICSTTCVHIVGAQLLPILAQPQPPGQARTNLGSATRLTGLSPLAKYGPTGLRMTNNITSLAAPTPRVGSVPIIVGRMYSDDDSACGTHSCSIWISLYVNKVK